jgi:predicted nuclease of restriction endonuclease-like RecB superfamily
MKKTKISKSQMQRGMVEGYRSGLESSVGEQLAAAKVRWEYESERIPYIPKKRTYTPDFIIKGEVSKMYIETKGRFLGSDRAKHLLIKEQYPQLDIRFVFTNPNQKLYKGAETTYGEWCEKHGFIFSKGSIPESWIRECMPEA